MNKPDDCESADLAMGVLDEFVFEDDESLAFIKQSQTFSQSSTSSFSRRLTDSHEPLHSWTKKSALLYWYSAKNSSEKKETNIWKAANVFCLQRDLEY